MRAGEGGQQPYFGATPGCSLRAHRIRPQRQSLGCSCSSVGSRPRKTHTAGARQPLPTAPSKDYTRGLAKESIRILFKYLPTAYTNGQHDLKAREKVGLGGGSGGGAAQSAQCCGAADAQPRCEGLAMQDPTIHTGCLRPSPLLFPPAQVHYAATIAGMSFANAFLGICHSMAHKLGARFHVPHGLANAGAWGPHPGLPPCADWAA